MGNILCHHPDGWLGLGSGRCLRSTIHRLGQVTHSSFVCYGSVIGVPHCAALDKEALLEGLLLLFTIFVPEFFDAARGTWCFKKGFLSPRLPSRPLHRNFPLLAQTVSTIHSGTQPPFGLIFSCPPHLEGRDHGAHTWCIWHISSVDRMSLDYEAGRGWTLSWTNPCVSSARLFTGGVTLGNYLSGTAVE